jgi:hypothetical protein
MLKPVIYLLLFIGMFLIIDGVYEERFASLKVNKEVQYKYISRSQYDDVFFHNDLSGVLQESDI